MPLLGHGVELLGLVDGRDWVKTEAHLLFCLLTSNILISNPIRQRHVLPSVDVIESNPHRGY